MKKYLIAVVLLLWATSAQAMMLGVDWTGNEVIIANDTGLMSNEYLDLGLGGPVGNQAIGFKAYEFTVPENSIINYLFVDATVVPNNRPNPNEPAYSLPQKMDVTFKLYEGTWFFGPGQFPAPDVFGSGQLPAPLTSSPYEFSSVDSHTSRTYSDFQIPFSSELNSNNTYWIWAGIVGPDGRHTEQIGPTFNYSTEFEGHPVVPEPATMLLFGAGLVGAFLRKRRA